MDDCAAAMVLMSLSCSPKSPITFFNRQGSIPAGTSLLAANNGSNKNNSSNNASNFVAKDSDAGRFMLHSMYHLISLLCILFMSL